MTLRRLLGATILAAAAATTTTVSADGPFGPIASRTFHWKAGTSIERPPEAGCNNNGDWLIVHGTNVASAKSIDVAPRVATWEQQRFPTSQCVAPDCIQLYVKVTGKDAVGPRTVTLKHADGRTLTTTFDVAANAGRCDYPQGGGKKP